MKTSTLEPKLTVKELAARWGWPEARLREFVRADLIPHLRIPGARSKGKGRIYFEASEVESWLERRRRREQSERQVREARRGRSRAEECARLGIPVDHDYAT